MNDYTIEMHCYEDGTAEQRTISAASVAEAIEQANDITTEWMEAGEWGEDGACVSAGWILYDGDGTQIEARDFQVDIEPDHECKIQEAAGYYADDLCGTDPDDHDWTSDGEGGCRENPGVWSHGGTTMSFDSHCRVCGLHRHEVHTGFQKNPGDHDTVEYRMLDEEEISWHRDNGSMD